MIYGGLNKKMAVKRNKQESNDFIDFGRLKRTLPVGKCKEIRTDKKTKVIACRHSEDEFFLKTP